MIGLEVPYANVRAEIERLESKGLIVVHDDTTFAGTTLIVYDLPKLFEVRLNNGEYLYVQDGSHVDVAKCIVHYKANGQVKYSHYDLTDQEVWKYITGI